ncbi:unnamed protein product [Diamesa serratosioi]
MTFPVTQLNTAKTNQESKTVEDDSIFGPPRTQLKRVKCKVPMISNELRLRDNRRKVIQLSLRKLEKIQSSEENLRRSVCINNTFCCLTADIRHEKQQNRVHHNNSKRKSSTLKSKGHCIKENFQCNQQTKYNSMTSTTLDRDLESLDRELISSPILLYDPEITQNHEQLQQAVVSRKRKIAADYEKRWEEEKNNERLVEALSSYQFYLPSSRLLSAIEDFPVDENRLKFSDIEAFLTNNSNNDDIQVVSGTVDFTQSNTINNALVNNLHNNIGSNCGKAALMDHSGIVQSLVVASLET